MTSSSPGVRALGAALGILLFAACGDTVNNTTTVAPRADWDLWADFAVNQNPTGTWTFGMPPKFTPFALFSKPADSALGGWQLDVDTALPSVTKNFSDSPFDVTIFQYTPQMVVVHPSATAPAIVRWTSPVNGVVVIEGFATKVQACAAPADMTRLTVRHGATVLFLDGMRADALGGATLDYAIQVAEGDTIDFEVDNGGAGDFSCDSTALSISITQY